jgi:hypothetical protein
MLRDEQVDFIRKEIEKSSISIPELKEDLLDHFCCFIEYEIKRGSSFEAAYNKALNDICPNGFNEIQRETVFLLNEKKILLMKKFTYAFGLITVMSFSLGFVFKIMHLPGWNLLTSFGSLGFILLFLPMLVVDRYKFNTKKVLSEKLLITLGVASIVVIGSGVVFKFLHAPGAGILFAGGLVFFIIGFLPFLFYKLFLKAKTLSEKLLLVAGFSSFVIIGMGAVFKFMHLPGAGIIFAGGATLFTLAFLPVLFFRMYQKAVGTL